MPDPMSTIHAPGEIRAGPWQPPAAAVLLEVMVVGVEIAFSWGLVLWVPVSIVQISPPVWDVASWRVWLVLPQQLCLDVCDGVLHLLLTREGRQVRGWQVLLILLHPQELGVAPS